MPTSETGEDRPLHSQVAFGHPADMGVHTPRRTQQHDRGRVVLLWEVRGDLEGDECQTRTSHVWALLLEVTKKSDSHMMPGREEILKSSRVVFQ